MYNSDGKENWDSNHWFGPEERNIQPQQNEEK